MRIINCTPHAIVVVDNRGKEIGRFPASTTPARVTIQYTYLADVEADEGFIVPLSDVMYGNIENLPDQKDNTMYIVSGMVKEAMPKRGDLLAPVDLYRNEAGQVIGCRSLRV